MHDSQACTIAPVSEAELPLLEAALRALAADLGDDYRADQCTLAAAVCGPNATCLALLATKAMREIGVILAAPVFSTTLGGSGLFVTDLWVAPAERRNGLARQLLASAAHEGARRNMGRFLKLVVYDTNLHARATYEHLGFAAHAGETNMALSGKALHNLKAPS
jgi:ribosomal protein S18 acetylase RimI-like enzyme